MRREALAAPPPGFDELSADEKVDYVQALWDRIADHPETVPVPRWHHEVLAERLASCEQDLASGLTLEESQVEIEAMLEARRDRAE